MMQRVADLLRDLPVHGSLFRAEWRTSGLVGALAKAGRVLFCGRPYRYAGGREPAAALAQLAGFARRPLISVVMPVYNAGPRWLERAVQSVREQRYPDWELCIVDDGSTRAETTACLRGLRHERVRIRFLDRNAGISAATNAALDMAGGEWIVFMDHDDELTRDALLEVAAAVNAGAPDVVYSDEDILTESGLFVSGHFKPDFSPDLLLSHNYVTHLLAVRAGFLRSAGGPRSAFDGAQDYDLILRLTEQTNRIVHIPKVLYHWRSVRTSTSRRTSAKPYTVAAGRRALEDALRRRGIDGLVQEANLPNYYRVRRTIAGQPRVSIIVPFRDRPELLRTCLESILETSTYRNFEVLGMDNNSGQEATRDLMRTLAARDGRVRFHAFAEPFNYARINNVAAAMAEGAHLVLMNSDVEILSPDWIEALLEHSQRPEVGAVGAKLYYPSGRVQHAGIVVGIAGLAGHPHRHRLGAETGYYNRLKVTQNVSAVTAALLMVKSDLYRQAGGLDEQHLATALNDVDFCLRLREQGYLNVFTPYCEARHHESASRGYETTPERQERYAREVDWFRQRHHRILEQGDPYYNLNLTLESEDFGYRRQPAATGGA
jgi:O-antigen biosynthesis protein